MKKKQCLCRLRSDTISRSFKPFVWIEITWRMLRTMSIVTALFKHRVVESRWNDATVRRSGTNEQTRCMRTVLSMPRRNIIATSTQRFHLLSFLHSFFVHSLPGNRSAGKSCFWFTCTFHTKDVRFFYFVTMSGRCELYAVSIQSYVIWAHIQ